MRSRLEGLGPVDGAAVAVSLGVAERDVDAALAKLAAEGVVMQGSFTPDCGSTEWCDRTLLARIHRYTVKRLRQEIEPVSAQDFMRFLFRWQHVVPSERRQGPDALDAVIAQLQGFEAPAAAWEAEILPGAPRGLRLHVARRPVPLRTRRLDAPHATAGRCGQYGSDPNDAGHAAAAPRRGALDACRAGAGADSQNVSLRAQQVARAPAHATAHRSTTRSSTARDSCARSSRRRSPSSWRLGLVSSDSFTGLRALLTPSEKRKPLPAASGAARRCSASRMPAGGR